MEKFMKVYLFLDSGGKKREEKYFTGDENHACTSVLQAL